MMLAAAKAFSASKVAITDIRPGNLPVALTLGAHHALDQSQAQSSAETVQSIMTVFPEGPDIVIDCVGMSSTITVSGNCRRQAHNFIRCVAARRGMLNLAYPRPLQLIKHRYIYAGGSFAAVP